MFTLDLEKLIWTQIKLKPKEGHTQHLMRAEHSTAISRFENKIYIFGGLDFEFKLTNELQVLSFKDWIPSKRDFEQDPTMHRLMKRESTFKFNTEI